MNNKTITMPLEEYERLVKMQPEIIYKSGFCLGASFAGAILCGMFLYMEYIGYIVAA